MESAAWSARRRERGVESAAWRARRGKRDVESAAWRARRGVENRITSATCKFFELVEFFRNRQIKLNLRIQYLNSLVRSRLTYLCQSWTLTKRQTERLQSTFTSVLRHMVKGGHQ